MIVIKFGYDVCPPCGAYEIAVIELIKEFRGQVFFGKVDLENSANSGSKKLLVMKRSSNLSGGVPHIAILKDGELENSFIYLNLGKLRGLIEDILTV